MKVYRHQNAEPFSVLWRRELGSEGTATYGGRPLLDYEKPYYRFIDADDPSNHAKYWLAGPVAAEGEETANLPSGPDGSLG